jgi:GNAT superfamily N-acetyltransferase
MTFWSHTTAAPTWWHALGFARLEPRFLRLEPPTLPPPTPDVRSLPVERATTDFTARIAQFWRRAYTGSDWYLDATEALVRTYLEDPAVILLVAVQLDGTIDGTVVATPLSPGEVTMSHGARLDRVYVIEGLCVSDAYRGRGLAGHLIALIDATVVRLHGPTALLWSRELSRVPYVSTAIQTATYAFLRCADVRARVAMPVPLPWDELCALWVANRWRFLGIVASLPDNRRGTLCAWKVPVDGADKLVVVSNTGRRTRAGLLIHEVIWCGWMPTSTLLYAAAKGQDYHRVLEAIATQYEGLLFASSTIQGGQAAQAWDEEGLWRYGTSGIHAWYIYNYLPPAFGDCEIHALREEL